MGEDSEGCRGALPPHLTALMPVLACTGASNENNSNCMFGLYSESFFSFSDCICEFIG